MDDIIRAAREWAGRPMALATVIEASGSAPRPRGGHMLVTGNGRFAGSISGGCVEYDVFALAESVIAGGPAGGRSVFWSNLSRRAGSRQPCSRTSPRPMRAARR
jgi:xanthine/CO dehydrogenase XdhC/CoxF family maturation factor